MIQVKIHKVLRGPQEEEPWMDAPNGPLYKTAWLCDVEDASGLREKAKVTVSSKNQGTNPPNGKYIVSGGVFCSKKRTEYHNMAQYYLDSAATRAFNGDSYGGGSGGGGIHGGGAPSRGHDQNVRGNYTFSELVDLFAVCHDSVNPVVGEVSGEALQSATATLFDAARQEGLKAPSHRGTTRQEESQSQTDDDEQLPYTEGSPRDGDVPAGRRLPDWAKDAPGVEDREGNDEDMPF